MATIRKRGEKWQVQVRRQGCAPISCSFTLKADADAWARQMEVEADGIGVSFSPSNPTKSRSRPYCEVVVDQHHSYQ